MEANTYPVTSMMYIQDNTTRVSLVSKQSMGGTSLASGEVEVLLDGLQGDSSRLHHGELYKEVS